MRRNLAPGCISSDVKLCRAKKKPKKKKTRGPKKRGKREKGFPLAKLDIEMQPGAKLRRISRGLYFAATRLYAAF